MPDGSVTAAWLAAPRRRRAKIARRSGRAPVEIEMIDTLAIDGEARTIKKIVQLPAAGVAVAFKLFVQG
jgi:hypothetical protein